MSKKIKLVIFEGADNAGKSTLVKKILGLNSKTELLNFKKPSNTEIVKVETSADLADYLNFIKGLNPDKIYLQDRGILSNLVYGTNYESANVKALRILRDMVDLKIVVLKRQMVAEDFADDKISISKDRFNEIIQAYNCMPLAQLGLSKSSFLKAEIIGDELAEEQLLSELETFFNT